MLRTKQKAVITGPNYSSRTARLKAESLNNIVVTSGIQAEGVMVKLGQKKSNMQLLESGCGIRDTKNRSKVRVSGSKQE